VSHKFQNGQKFATGKKEFRTTALVTANLNIEHIVVNHSIGFTNEEGCYTNYIEIFWSVMKSEMIKQRGIK
jgi:hypothetical protein